MVGMTGDTVTTRNNKSISMYLGGKAACFSEMIGNLFFLQAVGLDSVSTICPIEINHFIPHQARLYENVERMRAKSENLLNVAIINLKCPAWLPR